MCCHWSILSWSRCLIHIIFQWIHFAGQLGCKAHILIFSPATIFFLCRQLCYSCYCMNIIKRIYCSLFVEKKRYSNRCQWLHCTRPRTWYLFLENAIPFYCITENALSLIYPCVNKISYMYITGYPSDVGTSLYRAARFMCGEFKLWKGHSAVFVQL